MARSPLTLRNLHPDSVKIFEEIGKGGFSRVFAAEVSSYGQVLRAAAKKVRASILVDEVATIRQLDHRNIIKFYGIYKNAEDDAFIVMELAERKDLRHMLNNYRRGKVSPIRLPEELVKKWIVEAAHALHYLHSLHYIHRDIKSLNFLVMMNFSLKLGDLGLSKELVGTAKTKGGGTCQWMAPEVISEQFRSPKSDVFSYGIVVWEIVSTDIPHKEIKGEYSIMQAVCKDGKRPEIPDDCPPKVAEIMRGCWLHDHSKRPTMGDICKVYEQCNVNFDYIPDEALFQDKQTMGPPLAPGAAAAVHGTQGGGSLEVEKSFTPVTVPTDILASVTSFESNKYPDHDTSQATSRKIVSTQTKPIGDKGGEIVLQDYDLKLNIPEGALPPNKCIDVTLTVDTSINHAPFQDNQLVLSPVISCKPDRQLFLKPFTVSVPHSGFNISPECLQIWCKQENTESQWVKVYDGTEAKQDMPVIVDGQRIKFRVNHFTLFDILTAPMTELKNWLYPPELALDILAYLDPVNDPTSHIIYYYLRVYAPKKNDKIQRKMIEDSEKENMSGMCFTPSAFTLQPTGKNLCARTKDLFPIDNWLQVGDGMAGTIPYKLIQLGGLGARCDFKFFLKDDTKRANTFHGTIKLSQDGNRTTVERIDFRVETAQKNWRKTASSSNMQPSGPQQEWRSNGEMAAAAQGTMNSVQDVSGGIRQMHQTAAVIEGASMQTGEHTLEGASMQTVHTVVSDTDVVKILDTFGFNELKDVYIHLGLTQKDIDNASLDGDNAREKERKVLNLWRMKESEAATRDKLFDAMEKCPDSKARMDKLKKLWGYTL